MSFDHVTISNVRGAFYRYREACTVLGMIPTGQDVTLTEGSRANGIAYRVHLMSRDPETGRVHGGAWHPPAGDDFLGWTKREAFDRLADRASVLEATARHLKDAGILAEVCGHPTGHLLDRADIAAGATCTACGTHLEVTEQ